MNIRTRGVQAERKINLMADNASGKFRKINHRHKQPAITHDLTKRNGAG
jgi:hypothetical protein